MEWIKLGKGLDPIMLYGADEQLRSITFRRIVGGECQIMWLTSDEVRELIPILQEYMRLDDEG